MEREWARRWAGHEPDMGAYGLTWRLSSGAPSGTALAACAITCAAVSLLAGLAAAANASSPVSQPPVVAPPHATRSRSSIAARRSAQRMARARLGESQSFMSWRICSFSGSDSRRRYCVLGGGSSRFHSWCRLRGGSETDDDGGRGGEEKWGK